MKIFEVERDLEVVILPGEREPAVSGQHLVPLVHVDDLGESQTEDHHQGGVVEMGRSSNDKIRTDPYRPFGQQIQCNVFMEWLCVGVVYYYKV